MKPPSWLVIEMPKGKGLSADGQLQVIVRVRKWHPMFWWIAFQMLVLGRDPLTRKGDR